MDGGFDSAAAGVARLGRRALAGLSRRRRILSAGGGQGNFGGDSTAVRAAVSPSLVLSRSASFLLFASKGTVAARGDATTAADGGQRRGGGRGPSLFVERSSVGHAVAAPMGWQGGGSGGKSNGGGRRIAKGGTPRRRRRTKKGRGPARWRRRPWSIFNNIFRSLLEISVRETLSYEDFGSFPHSDFKSFERGI